MVLSEKLKLFSLLAIITLTFVVIVPAWASQPFSQNESDPHIDAVVERALQEHDVTGASVGVIKNSKISWTKGYGFANTELKTPVTSDTVFEAASLAKPVTAWAIMTLVEDGKLDLDAPIEKYVTRWHLPPSEFDHSKITIRRILSHTAGLSEDGDVGVDPGVRVPTIEEALNGAVLGMRPLRVVAPPGDDYHYASTGYTLLELAIEEVTGERFSRYIKREVLDPLGMTQSSYEWTPELEASAATGYDWYNRPLPRYQHSTRAQGGLISTAKDLATFMAASMPGQNGEPIGRGVLKPESVAQILTPVQFANQEKSSHIIGLGYDLFRVNGDLIGVRKTGDHRGFKPIMVMDLKQNEGIAIMTNSDRAAIGFVIDVACAWSKDVAGNPMQNDCRELWMIRNIQLGIASLLTFAALIYLILVLRGVQKNKRAFNWKLSRGRIIRIVLLIASIFAWWVLWHTDILFTQILHRYPCCGYAVTVRALVPWPTAFVWISWGLTTWFVVLITTTFTVRVKR